MKTYEPVIKWSGSKRSQAQEIISHFPETIDVYYEPFCGGCSVARALMESDHKVAKYVLMDANQHLIDALNLIKNFPEEVIRYYTKLWNAMKAIESIKGKEEFYNETRERFNKSPNPFDFIFLNRTCFNGLIRYNSSGAFNSPFHLNRDGIMPSRYSKVINEWSQLFNRNNVTIGCLDYKENQILGDKNSFMYLDPPYANTSGMYHSKFHGEDFFDYLRSLRLGYAFSYDGISGQNNMTVDVPKDLYDEHIYIKSGNSSFKRLKNDKSAIVFESLYLKNN